MPGKPRKHKRDEEVEREEALMIRLGPEGYTQDRSRRQRLQVEAAEREAAEAALRVALTRGTRVAATPVVAPAAVTPVGAPAAAATVAVLAETSAPREEERSIIPEFEDDELPCDSDDDDAAETAPSLRDTTTTAAVARRASLRKPPSGIVAVSSPPEDEGEECEVCRSTAYHPINDKMVGCKSCDVFGCHLRCMVPPRVDVPLNDWFCQDCTVRTNAMEAAKTAAALPNSVVGMGLDANGKPAWSFAANVSRLKSFANQGKNALTFAQIQAHTKGITVGRDAEAERMKLLLAAVDRVVSLTPEQKLRAEQAQPPHDIARKMRSIIDVQTESQVLTEDFQGLRASFTFQYVNPAQAALELYQSEAVRAVGRIRRFGQADCEARAEMGTWEAELIDELDKAHPSRDKSSELIISIVVFSDATVVSNEKLHPVMMCLESMSNNARTTHVKISHAVVAFLPTLETIAVSRISDGARMSLIDGSNENARKAVAALRDKAFRVLFEKIAAAEKGFPVELNGKLTTVRVVLSRIVNDMEERHDVLGLKNRHPCSHCYAFGTVRTNKAVGEANDFEVLFRIHDAGRPQQIVDFNELRKKPRTLENDKALFSTARDSGQNLSRKDQELVRKAFARLTGLEGSSDSTLGKKLLMSHRAASYFGVEPMHMFSGAITRFMVGIESVLGDKFFKFAAKAYGNETLGIQNPKYHIHIMEVAFTDLRSILLALRDPQWASRPAAHEFQRLVGLWLVLVWLAKDDAVGLSKVLLKQVCEDLYKGMEALENDGKLRITPKLHELIHLPTMAERFGSIKKLNAGVFERLHGDVKDAYRNKTSRHKISSLRSMLEMASMQRVVDASSALVDDTAVVVDPSLPAHPLATFRLIAAGWKEIPNDTVRNAAARVVEVLGLSLTFVGAPDPLPLSPVGSVKFATKLECSITCALRKQIIKSPETIAAFENDWRFFDVLAYVDNPHSEGMVPCQQTPHCMYHNPDFQLFAPISREAETLHGIPLLFFEPADKSGDVSAVIIPLKPYAPEQAVANILALVESEILCEFKIVHAKQIRGVCKGYRERIELNHVAVFPSRRAGDKS
jgi:hypothetical protein